MKKIAVTGGCNRTRSILVHSLSILTEYPLIRPSSYSSLSIKWGFNKDVMKCSFDELFVYALSVYTERLKTEQYYDEFISDGFILSETCIMEDFSKEAKASKRKKNEMLSMCKSFSKIAAEYAARNYDLIVFIKENTPETMYHDEILQTYFTEFNIPVLIYDKQSLIEIINEISNKIELKISVSAKIALDKAVTLI